MFSFNFVSSGGVSVSVSVSVDENSTNATFPTSSNIRFGFASRTDAVASASKVVAAAVEAVRGTLIG